MINSNSLIIVALKVLNGIKESKQRNLLLGHQMKGLENQLGASIATTSQYLEVSMQDSVKGGNHVIYLNQGLIIQVQPHAGIIVKECY